MRSWTKARDASEIVSEVTRSPRRPPYSTKAPQPPPMSSTRSPSVSPVTSTAYSSLRVIASSSDSSGLSKTPWE